MAENKADSLDELIKRHKEALNGPAEDDAPRQLEEDIYGDHDLENEIAEEEANGAELRKQFVEEQQLINQQREESRPMMPPNSLDVNFQADAINFQTDKLAIVTTMVNKVIAKNHLVDGEIPECDEQGIPVKRRVIGDLINMYEKNGDVITPEFERKILDNWRHTENYVQPESADENVEFEKAIQEAVPTININVEEGTPVTINVDESIIPNEVHAKEVNIIVHEISETEMRSSRANVNSQKEGIIRKYDSGINDVPITLPLSAYRCVMRGVNYYDFLRLAAPTSNNPSDVEIKRWSVIYDHLKNCSIGKFENFDDFLKKTKYQDKEVFMWAILVATADDEEELSIGCGNRKCQKKIRMKYRPRNIIHLSEDKISDVYKKTYDVAPGKEAVAHFNDSWKITRYELPDTKIIVDISEPSAFEFITEKLPLIQRLYARYETNKPFTEMDPEDPMMVEFNYLSGHALYISAMTIIDDNGEEYRYTNWDDIEKIIMEALSIRDSGILLKIIEKSRTNQSPVDFYLTDINCPHCGRHEDRIPINDIGNTLLFQVSRRLQSTAINLIEM